MSRLRVQLNSVTDKYSIVSDKFVVSSNYEDKFKNLHSNLVGCLSIQEKEAANIAGCSEEIYAIELLKIFQEWKNHNKKPSDYGKDRNTYRGY